jgi:hypothetical protein
MSCEITLQVMNDFLNNTLSVAEEQKVKSHLVECENCRVEFHNLEKADTALRQVVCDMVASIDVPGNLMHRIEKIISAENKKKKPESRIFMLLKSPAAAAALLFVVLTAGFLSYQNYFNMLSNQPKVVLSMPAAGNSAAEKPGSIASENAGGASKENILQTAPDRESKVEDTKNLLNAADQLSDQMESPAGVVNNKPLLPAADQAPELLNKFQLSEEQRTAIVTNVPLVSGAGMPSANIGTIDEAVREAGFIPAKPAYLPQEAVLTAVTWLPDEISQNFQVGGLHFTVSQGRLNAAYFGDDKISAPASAVDINGSLGYLQEEGLETGGIVTGVPTTLRWREGDWAFSVSGDLPKDEIIKISNSLK